jgi:hypothetical protein
MYSIAGKAKPGASGSLSPRKFPREASKRRRRKKNNLNKYSLLFCAALQSPRALHPFQHPMSPDRTPLANATLIMLSWRLEPLQSSFETFVLQSRGETRTVYACTVRDKNQTSSRSLLESLDAVPQCQTACSGVWLQGAITIWPNRHPCSRTPCLLSIWPARLHPAAPDSPPAKHNPCQPLPWRGTLDARGIVFLKPHLCLEGSHRMGSISNEDDTGAASCPIPCTTACITFLSSVAAHLPSGYRHGIIDRVPRHILVACRRD